MNNLSKVSGEFYIHDSLYTEKYNLIGRLPVEIFMKVLSCLRNSDIQQTCLVSRCWRKISIAFAKCKAHFKITEFAKFLGKNLQPGFYSTQMETFFQIANSTTILASRTLAQFQSSIYLQRDQILHTLKYLNTEDLNNLAKLYNTKDKSIFFNQTFRLAKVYKSLDKSKVIFPDSSKRYALLYITGALTQHNDIDKAIRVAKTIPITDDKAYALADISKVLVKNNEINKAIKVAKMIPINNKKARVLRKISNALVKNNEIDKAIKVANMISIRAKRKDALRKISMH